MPCPRKGSGGNIGVSEGRRQEPGAKAMTDTKALEVCIDPIIPSNRRKTKDSDQSMGFDMEKSV